MPLNMLTLTKFADLRRLIVILRALKIRGVL